MRAARDGRERAPACRQARSIARKYPFREARSRERDGVPVGNLIRLASEAEPGEVIKQELGSDVLHKQRHSKRRKRRGRR